MPRSCSILVFTLLIGCQGKGDLSGKVTYKEKPVLVGSVLAVGSDGIPKSCVIENGGYRIEGLPAGEIKLSVSSPNPAQQRVAQRKPGAGATSATNKEWYAIPEKYAAFETSGLTATVRGRTNHDIKLD